MRRVRVRPSPLGLIRVISAGFCTLTHRVRRMQVCFAISRNKPSLSQYCTYGTGFSLTEKHFPIVICVFMSLWCCVVFTVSRCLVLSVFIVYFVSYL